jgi:hypothetical protein
MPGQLNLKNAPWETVIFQLLAKVKMEISRRLKMANQAAQLFIR